ncbi:hydrogenase expression/formation protein HupJ [Bradyrhizobium sp. SSBR45G]|uniref:[NiFe]-hydrogenase assembly chaperone HybE n=1 Tax=unclassified Bradyrhizobium TaxID=2631580 RepID=UPI0023429C92|nr:MULTISPECIES: [NiFe]-hydrogenase assembly chaperone HybE [unclassified Bradyrhizobium]GLH82206.1 hydrogenase expression/formation protein HupJ [Bradyrhizobium sp. SSBR45G]GLH89639.1 hydrogenase expression/formation protein HupJ [Bradyrhizobium sp. SSBR45R]
MTAAAAGQGTAEDAPAAWGERLACAYREIGARTMRELPIYHDALTVEAVGFTCFQGRTIGIVITPWFMNVVTPVEQGIAGSSVTIALPAGAFAFTIGDIAGIRGIASCSLFSPMFEFEDMAAARTAAEAAMATLMTAPDDAAPPARKTERAIDRRAFLRGTLAESRP